MRLHLPHTLRSMAPSSSSEPALSILVQWDSAQEILLVETIGRFRNCPTTNPQGRVLSVMYSGIVKNQYISTVKESRHDCHFQLRANSEAPFVSS
mmetsp:Transcript_14442/g.21747  ORF Transcript_14442/g.21747 Transcript_14442/m.21747 type:complete len:95 (+) Transcript_14442:120-404(+)